MMRDAYMCGFLVVWQLGGSWAGVFCFCYYYILVFDRLGIGRRRVLSGRFVSEMEVFYILICCFVVRLLSLTVWLEW